VTKTCVLKMIEQLKPGVDSLGIVSFDTEAQVICPMRDIQNEGPDLKMIESIKRLFPTGIPGSNG